MPPPDPFLLYSRKFQALHVPHMITDGVAAMFYGEPRFTNAVDIVVALKPEDLPRLQEAFPPDDFLLSASGSAQERGRPFARGSLQPDTPQDRIQGGHLSGGRGSSSGLGLARVRGVEFRGEPLALAPPEYVILKKLEFFAEGEPSKHLRDIQRMLVGLGEEWDRSALLKLIEEHGLQAEWARALGPTVS